MVQDPRKGTYDPVPPYDALDVESGPEPEAAADVNRSDEVQDESNPDVYVIHRTTEESRRLRQRECCKFGLAYFSVAVVGTLLLVTIVTH